MYIKYCFVTNKNNFSDTYFILLHRYTTFFPKCE